MKKLFWLAALFLFTKAGAQVFTRIELNNALFKTGDNPEWSKPELNDEDWKSIKPQYNWDKQGFADYDGFGWYRFHFELSSLLKSNNWWPDSLRIFLAKIDDADEIFLNGTKISKTGRFPDDPGGYSTQWDRQREIRLAMNDPLLQWDKDNLLAVRVYDGGGLGGIFGALPGISALQFKDLARLGYQDKQLRLTHQLPGTIQGKLTVKITDPVTKDVLQHSTQSISIEPKSSYSLPLTINSQSRVEISASFTESRSEQSVYLQVVPPYILTPAPGASPRINNATVFGIRPGSPFLFKIAATGEKPLKYSVSKLPAGLKLDPLTGIITGTITKAGSYTMQLQVKNKKGTARKSFTVKCGDTLALTPPMGWNSWNCWGLSVSQDRVKASAQALIDKGLIDHGWTYMNIDDGWEAPARAANGDIITNQKFPDMKGLGDWLHSKGLKFGIYSSPGPRTCGGYLGSYQYEMRDAQLYNEWGIDYLKYDWCSYGEIHGGKDTSLNSYIKPYEVMKTALRSQPRDIVYSLCQYGMKEVWKWGADVDGNCWRTTGDIEDTWESMYAIAFNQIAMQPWAKPGRWNDPDMLIVGNVGWGDQLHPTRLNADEQYTHISLWSLLASPLLIGCDIASMDDFTVSLLSNDEVIAVNQDAAGKQAIRVIKNDTCQVWVKELEDGSKAVGLFNVSDDYATIKIKGTDLGLEGDFKIRDLWRQKELESGNSYSSRIPAHGVVLLKIRP
ncbi:MAG: putative Ig domain-containing protein [Chitinophagales bacterium]|nr:putative Ig domain-containing protein [Chitinophagales bacterium]